MLLRNFNKQSEFSYKVIQTEYDKPLVMIKNGHEYFENSTNCWICIKRYEKDEVKLKDHDHISSVFWTDFGQTFKFQAKKRTFIPLYTHIWKFVTIKENYLNKKTYIFLACPYLKTYNHEKKAYE